MREILFRGKRKDNGEWVEGDLFNNYDKRKFIGELVVDDYTGFTCDQYEVGIGIVEVIPETICQFIGLVDKNGKKIFEGDIICIHNEYTGDMNPFNAVVGYIKGAFVSWGECSYGYTPFYSWNVPLVWWEVVGNIYDNPELIKLEETTIQRDME